MLLLFFGGSGGGGTGSPAQGGLIFLFGEGGLPAFPGTISATSTFGGATQTQHVLRGSVAATSTLSGGVSRLPRSSSVAQAGLIFLFGNGTFPIFSNGSVSATSTFGGSLPTKHLFSGSIAATSAFSGSSLHPGRPITPAEIDATSFVSVTSHSGGSGSGAYGSGTYGSGLYGMGSGTGPIFAQGGLMFLFGYDTSSGRLPVLRAVIASSINATSAMSGGLFNSKSFTGSIAATSSMSGRLSAKHVLRPGTINATSTIAGGLPILRALFPASIAATSTFSGRIPILHVINGQIVATSTISSSFGGSPAVSGHIAATSTLAGILPTRHLLRGTVTANSTLAGALSKEHGFFSGNVAAISTLSGSGISFLTQIGHGNMFAFSTFTGNIGRTLGGNILAAAVLDQSFASSLFTHRRWHYQNKTGSAALIGSMPGFVHLFVEDIADSGIVIAHAVPFGRDRQFTNDD